MNVYICVQHDLNQAKRNLTNDDDEYEGTKFKKSNRVAIIKIQMIKTIANANDLRIVLIYFMRR